MKIFLNNTEIDTFPTASPVAVTYALAPLGDVSSRRANVTTSFTIPLTDNNRKILGLSDTVQGTDSTPYAPLSCTIYQGGANVIDGGKAVIERITPDGVELSAYSGLFSFFESIRDKDLQSLDFSDMDHDWTLADVAALCDPAALADGVTWGIANLGALPFTTVDIQYQRPQVTFYELCKRIAEAQSYTLAGDFWTSEPFARTAILLMESDEQRRKNFTEARNFVYARDEAIRFSGTILDNVTPQTQSFQVDFTVSQDPGDQWDGDSYNETSRSIVNFKVELDWLDYKKNDPLGEYSEYDFTTELIHIDAGGVETVLDSNIEAVTFLHSVTLEATAVTLTAGESVIVRASLSVAPPGPPIGYDLLYSFTLSGTIKTSNATGDFVLLSPITVSALFPDMTQKELLLNVAKMFGLILVADDKAGTLTAVRFQDIIEATGNAIDWSEKLVPALGTVYAEKRTRADKYGQRSVLRFTNDDLSPDSDTGRSWLTVPDTTLDREKIIAEIPFAASGTITNASIPIPILYAAMYEYDGVSAYTETDKDFTDRVTLLIDDHPGGAGITLMEGAGGATTALTAGNYLACIPVGDDYGAHFDRFLFRDNYTALQTVLENYQELDCNFMLSPVDIVRLDLTRLIYLRQFGAYFYIEKVSNYVYGQPTKVTLIKVKP